MKQKNVLGTDLEICNENPMTGFFRDGCCNTNEMDVGSHTVCVIVTKEFLEFYADQREDNPFKKSEIDSNKKIIVYCGAGGQGALATKTLQDMGFQDVSNLEGGSDAWIKAGNKLTK